MSSLRVALVAVFLPWWWLTAAFGGVYPWAWAPALVLVAGACGVVALLRLPSPPRLARLVSPWLVILAVALAQLVPLPVAWVGALGWPPGPLYDPGAAYLLIHPAAGPGLAEFYSDSFVPLSVRPGRTLLFAIAWLSLGLWVRAAATVAVVAGPVRFARLLAGTALAGALVSILHGLAAPFGVGLLGWQRASLGVSTAAPLLNPNSQAAWLALLLGVVAAASLVSRPTSWRLALVDPRLPWLLVSRLGPFGGVLLAVVLLDSAAALGGVLVVAGFALSASRLRLPARAFAWCGVVALLLAGAAARADLAAKLWAMGDLAAGRPVLWRLGLELWSQRPWFGGGLDTFGIAALPLYYREPGMLVLAPHSVVVEAAADGGLVLVAAVGWMACAIVSLLLPALRPLRGSRSAWPCAGAAWGLFGFVVPLLVGVPLHVPAVPATAGLLIALVAARSSY